jgi:hypothetical protein
MNTTRLIGHWSMDGARNDLRQGFRSAVDILAVVSGLTAQPSAETGAPQAADGLLVKPAGEGDWQPLLAAGA